MIGRSYFCAISDRCSPLLFVRTFPYFPTIAGCVVCPDPVLALKSPVKYKTARLGMLCSKLSSLSQKSCLIEGVSSLVGSVGACTFIT